MTDFAIAGHKEAAVQVEGLHTSVPHHMAGVGYRGLVHTGLHKVAEVAGNVVGIAAEIAAAEVGSRQEVVPVAGMHRGVAVHNQADHGMAVAVDGTVGALWKICSAFGLLSALAIGSTACSPQDDSVSL